MQPYLAVHMEADGLLRSVGVGELSCFYFEYLPLLSLGFSPFSSIWLKGKWAFIYCTRILFHERA